MQMKQTKQMTRKQSCKLTPPEEHTSQEHQQPQLPSPPQDPQQNLQTHDLKVGKTC